MTALATCRRPQEPSTKVRPRGGVLHAGFTLIEVLAALVIVALGMLAAIEAVNQAARNGYYLREKTLAHWIGMNVITERRLQSSPPDVNESSDELDFAGQRWKWTMKVTQTEVDSMRRMDVSVRLASADEKSSLATVSGFYGSAIGAAGGQGLPWAGGGAPGTIDQPGDTQDEEEERPSRDRNRNRPPRPERPPPVEETE